MATHPHIGRKYALVCASNMNRSMEAHNRLAKKGLNVYSFGTSDRVKLPGPAKDKPNVYAFGTPYEQIFHELRDKDQTLYTSNGILTMLKRNMKVKRAPQRWQDNVPFQCDVVITYENRVYEALLDDMSRRTPTTFDPVYVVNMPVTDNHIEAAVGAVDSLDFCLMLDALGEEEWRDRFDEVVAEFEKRKKRKLTYSVHFF
eukprot:TRINITY_DN3103_c0_g1_i1.p1 TRINITY_DN3103_c0_g1~~TRINITY_DN3103_c0_g1_i1.p1  ORF type:complete len:201 (-),score=53.29 TRINITY_DN3103_c0_g1_i1:150-752(-)